MHPKIAGNLIHDLHTAVLMKEHGITEIRTADTDFHQFAFLRVVDPLAPESDPSANDGSAADEAG